MQIHHSPTGWRGYHDRMLDWAREGGLVIHDVDQASGKVRALFMGARDLQSSAKGYEGRSLAEYLVAGAHDRQGTIEESWTLRYIAYFGPRLSTFPAHEKVTRWRQEMEKRERLCAYLGLESYRLAYRALVALTDTPPGGTSFRHAQRIVAT